MAASQSYEQTNAPTCDNATSAPSSSRTTPPSLSSLNMNDKRRLVQQQLLLLLHARECQKRERDGQAPACQVPYCREMKGILNHVKGCRAGKACTVAHCKTSIQIIQHWERCTSNDCRICVPMRPTPSDQKGSCLETPLSPTIPHYQYYVPDTPTVNKDWHPTVCSDMRRHLVMKIVQSVFPNTDIMTLEVEGMTDIIAYARKIEVDMFEAATSKEDFYQLMAEKIYNIQTELREHLRKRKERLQQQQSAAEKNKNEESKVASSAQQDSSEKDPEPKQQNQQPQDCDLKEATDSCAPQPKKVAPAQGDRKIAKAHRKKDSKPSLEHPTNIPATKKVAAFRKVEKVDKSVGTCECGANIPKACKK